jgi:hypothetical protein
MLQPLALSGTDARAQRATAIPIPWNSATGSRRRLRKRGQLGGRVALSQSPMMMPWGPSVTLFHYCFAVSQPIFETELKDNGGSVLKYVNRKRLIDDLSHGVAVAVTG